jgi:hypothetical protein
MPTTGRGPRDWGAAEGIRESLAPLLLLWNFRVKRFFTFQGIAPASPVRVRLFPTIPSAQSAESADLFSLYIRFLLMILLCMNNFTRAFLDSLGPAPSPADPDLGLPSPFFFPKAQPAGTATSLPSLATKEDVQQAGSPQADTERNQPFWAPLRHPRPNTGRGKEPHPPRPPPARSRGQRRPRPAHTKPIRGAVTALRAFSGLRGMCHAASTSRGHDWASGVGASGKRISPPQCEHVRKPFSARCLGSHCTHSAQKQVPQKRQRLQRPAILSALSSIRPQLEQVWMPRPLATHAYASCVWLPLAPTRGQASSCAIVVSVASCRPFLFRLIDLETPA